MYSIICIYGRCVYQLVIILLALHPLLPNIFSLTPPRFCPASQHSSIYITLNCAVVQQRPGTPPVVRATPCEEGQIERFVFCG